MAARNFSGEKVKIPVSGAEVFPKLKAMYKLPNGALDYRIVRAMYGIDGDLARADLELQKALRDDLMKQLHKQLQ